MHPEFDIFCDVLLPSVMGRASQRRSACGERLCLREEEYICCSCLLVGCKMLYGCLELSSVLLAWLKKAPICISIKQGNCLPRLRPTRFCNQSPKLELSRLAALLPGNRMLRWELGLWPKKFGSLFRDDNSVITRQAKNLKIWSLNRSKGWFPPKWLDGYCQVMKEVAHWHSLGDKSIAEVERVLSILGWACLL